jgi:hypothetical protein
VRLLEEHPARCRWRRGRHRAGTEAPSRSLSVLDPVDEAVTCRFTLAATLV